MTVIADVMTGSPREGHDRSRMTSAAQHPGPGWIVLLTLLSFV